MADVDTPFGAAEQTLAFTLSYITAQPVLQPEDLDMFMGILRDTQGHVDRSHPYAEVLAIAADNLILAHAGNAHRVSGVTPKGLTWSNASWGARLAVAKFSKWRAARANEAFQIQRRKVG